MIADLDQLTDEAAEAVLALLERYRVEVLALLLATREPLSAQLRGLLLEVDLVLARLRRELEPVLVRHLRLAAGAGDQAVLAALTRAGFAVPLGYVGVSEQLLRTAAAYVADLVTGLTLDARARITREVRLAALGGTSTTDLIARIGRTLDDPSVFRTLALRAEAIARTEVSRVHNMAWSEQAREINGRYPGMRKVWEHSTSSPGFTLHQRRQSRPEHVALWRRTTAEPIPVDAPFRFPDGTTAMYPHDPSLPAGHVVNCRCRARLIAPPPG